MFVNAYRAGDGTWDNKKIAKAHTVSAQINKWRFFYYASLIHSSVNVSFSTLVWSRLAAMPLAGDLQCSRAHCSPKAVAAHRRPWSGLWVADVTTWWRFGRRRTVSGWKNTSLRVTATGYVTSPGRPPSAFRGHSSRAPRRTGVSSSGQATGQATTGLRWHSTSSQTSCGMSAGRSRAIFWRCLVATTGCVMPTTTVIVF